MDKTFKDYLNETGEVGSISSIVQSIVYVSGLPGVRPKEMVIGETVYGSTYDAPELLDKMIDEKL